MFNVLEVLRIKKYLAIAVISALLMGFLYVFSQVLFIFQNIDVWLANIPLYNAVLFIIFDILFGITISYQIYVRNLPKVCSVKKSAGTTSTATFAGFLVAQCPACASLGALFLPIGAITFLTVYGPVINLVTIGLLLFTIYYLGGFRRTKVVTPDQIPIKTDFNVSTSS